MKLPNRRLAVAALVSCPWLPLSTTPAAVAKPFLDARFAIDIPDDFVVSKRKSTTGTLFVSGNFPRFSVVSVTAWPVAALLQDDLKARDLPGLPVSQPLVRMGSSWAEMGTAKEVVNLLLRARDREANGGALQSVLLDSSLSADGHLLFHYSTESPVSDPDELERQKGVRRQIRVTTANSVLGTVPGADGSPVRAIFTAWGSALEQDYANDLKMPLEASVGSFSVASGVAVPQSEQADGGAMLPTLASQ